MLLYEKLSDQVLDGCFTVHRKLGPGLLEGPYHNALFLYLRKQGVRVYSSFPFKVKFEGDVVGEYFADLVVDNRIIIEVKAVCSLNKAMEAQLLNYLHISGLQVGYLVNFQGAPGGQPSGSTRRRDADGYGAKLWGFWEELKIKNIPIRDLRVIISEFRGLINNKNLSPYRVLP